MSAVTGWLAGAGRWLWANREEVLGLASSMFGFGLYVMWNYAARPRPSDADPAALAAWRRRERFAFAVWHKSGLVPKWMRESMPWPDPSELEPAPVTLPAAFTPGPPLPPPLATPLPPTAPEGRPAPKA